MSVAVTVAFAVKFCVWLLVMLVNDLEEGLKVKPCNEGVRVQFVPEETVIE